MEISSDWSWFFDLTPLMMLVAGWFIIFNGAKHIATRNEAKAILNDFSSITKKHVDLSIEFWLSFDSLNKRQNAIHFKRAITFVTYLRHYKDTLEKYDLRVLSEQDLIVIKSLLSETPERDVVDKQLEKYCDNKTYELTSLVNTILIQANEEFYRQFSPTNTSLLHTFSLSSKPIMMFVLALAFILIPTIVCVAFQYK